jgi:hypothetical protein
MKLALGVFGAIKLAQSFDLRWSRARKGYRRLPRSGHATHVVVVAYLEESLATTSELDLQRNLEKLLTHDQVIRIDDLMGGENFLKSYLSTCHLFLLCATDEAEEQSIQRYLSTCALSPFHVQSFPLSGPWNPDDKSFSKLVAPFAIETINSLLRNVHNMHVKASS